MKENKFEKQGINVSEVLTNLRGYDIQTPRGEDVVLLMTGGVDSSIAADLVISNWGCRVYPFYVQRGAKAERYEIEALHNVLGYLNEKYPEKINPPFMFPAEVPPVEIKNLLSRERVGKVGYQFRNTILQSYAIQYGLSLNDNGKKVRTVMAGSVASDFFPGSTETSLLTNTLHAVINLREPDWQVMSPFLRPDLLEGHDKLEKVDIMKWAIKNDFPLEMTRTCTNSTPTECLDCDECKERVETLAKAESLVRTIT